MNKVDNVYPTVEVTTDTTVYLAGQTIKLNKVTVSDSDGWITSYKWTPYGNNIAIQNATTLKSATIVAPSVIYNGVKKYYFKLSVTDNDGAVKYKIYTVSVQGENTKPVAIAQSVSTTKNTPVSIVLSGTDADGDSLTYSKSNPTHGVLSGTKPNLIYTPDDGYVGSDSFSFLVNDGTDNSSFKTISITVKDILSTGTILHNGTTYGTVTSPHTGKVWLDRNLGASQVCTTLDDTACYGDYYQWGRDADGHEKSNSATTTTQASTVTNVGDSFITSGSTYNYDWAKDADSDGSQRTANWSATDGSSVCPVGYRVPTIDELKAETTLADTPVKNNSDAVNNFLKLPSAGSHSSDSGSMNFRGSYGIVWSSSVSGSHSDCLYFASSSALTYSSYRANGFSVRCLKD